MIFVGGIVLCVFVRGWVMLRPVACNPAGSRLCFLKQHYLRARQAVRYGARATDALFVLGETQDERAEGEVSFAHGGCGGTQFPREDPASAERTQCAFYARA